MKSIKNQSLFSTQPRENKLNAPIRKNKSVNKLNIILSAADL